MTLDTVSGYVRQQAATFSRSEGYRWPIKKARNPFSSLGQTDRFTIMMALGFSYSYQWRTGTLRIQPVHPTHTMYMCTKTYPKKKKVKVR